MNNQSKAITILAIVTIVIAIYIFKSRDTHQPVEVVKTEEITSINIGYFSRAIGYAPYFVAQEKGWFEKDSLLSGIEVKHTIYGDRATISDAFDSGELDVLLSAEIPAIICRAQGNDIRIVGITGYISLTWLGRTEFGKQSISDFVGRQVAFQSGTSSHYGLLTTMSKAGISDTDVTLRNMRAVEAKTAFESDKVDAWVVWSPFYEQQMIAGLGIPVENSAYNYATTIAVTNDLITKSPKVVEALLNILESSKNWIQENPVETDTIVSKATLQTLPVAHKALQNVSFSVDLNQDLIDTFQGMSKFLAQNKATRNGVVIDIRKDMIYRLGGNY